MNLEKLGTETRNKNSMNLDEMEIIDILKLMNMEDINVILAIRENLQSIQDAINLIVKSIKSQGRLIYIGAGTSGRMGVMDAAECMPTFGTENEVQAILAGGNDAMFHAIEGAEDDMEMAKVDLKKIGITSNDVIVGITASGRTPYVISALQFAQKQGCKTVSISCNIKSEISLYADVPIEIFSGPEVLTGSTRLKSGTVQKLVCNMISTISMIKLGKVYSNLMVDIVATNKKLEDRSRRIVIDATGCTSEEALTALKSCKYHCKTAIIMILCKVSAEQAEKLLDKYNGIISKVLVNTNDRNN